MATHRTIALSLAVTAVAVLSSGCGAALSMPVPAESGTSAEICHEFRNFEVDHRDDPDYLASYSVIWSDGMTQLADRAGDPVTAGHLRSIATQFAALGEAEANGTLDQVEQEHPDVFAAGEQAWVAMEAQCGAAVVPTP